jgi:hypothetical protein
MKVATGIMAGDISATIDVSQSATATNSGRVVATRGSTAVGAAATNESLAVINILSFNRVGRH